MVLIFLEENKDEDESEWADFSVPVTECRSTVPSDADAKEPGQCY